MTRVTFLEIAVQLRKWAEESEDGGWSTHQVDPMRQLARKLVGLSRSCPHERDALHAIWKQLIQWADESVKGGWSTHQVDPMRELANKICIHLAETEVRSSPYPSILNRAGRGGMM